MSKEILKSLGLSDNEAEVYLLLLQLQEALASEIAKKSKISRPHIYDTLAKLVDKGLASYVIKNNKKYFRPADPEILKDLHKAKEMSLNAMLPDLKQMYKPGKEKPVVEVYEGKDGLKTVLNDILRTNKDFKAFGGTRKWLEVLPIFMKQYINERKKKGFKGKVINPEGSKVMDLDFNEYRFIPKQYASPATTIMYGDKTFLVLWLDTPVGIVIENKELSQSFNNYFDYFWNAETKTFTGKDGAKVFLNDILKEKPQEYLIKVTSAGRIYDLIPEYRMEWDKKRVALGIHAKRIANDVPEVRKATSVYDKIPLRETKFLPLEEESPLATCTYNDKTWIISWEIENPIFILIQNKHIANGFKQEFYRLWDQQELTYRDVKGIKRLFNRMLDENPDEILAFGTSAASIKLFPEFIKRWHERREDKNITIKVIYNRTQEAKDRLKWQKQTKLFKYKFMPATYPSPVATMIYNDNIVIVNLMKGGFATIIKNKEIAEIYKKQFNSFWEIASDRFG